MYFELILIVKVIGIVFKINIFLLLFIVINKLSRVNIFYFFIMFKFLDRFYIFIN